MVWPMTKATARWTGSKVLFDVESASGHKVQIDEAPILGDDGAMRPTEILLGALGACTGINAVLLLKKFKQPLRSLEARRQVGAEDRRLQAVDAVNAGDAILVAI